METVVQAPPDPELNLLTEWGDPDLSPRTRTAAIASVIFHAGVLLILILLPPQVGTRRPESAVVVHRVITPLIEPLTELTQKAPNTGKVQKEFNAAEVTPRPRIQVPAAAPSTTRGRATKQAAIPTPPTPRPATPQPVPLPEAPKVDAGVKQPPKAEVPQVAAAAPPPPIVPVQPAPPPAALPAPIRAYPPPPAMAP